MKALTAYIALLVSMVASVGAQEVLRPVVAPKFGMQITIQAEFVEKSNTYYSQNIVSAPFALKVISVDGMILKEPVQIEYRLKADKKIRSKIERLGTIVTFEAYESIYQPPFADPWMEKGEQGMGFTLIHILNIRIPAKKG